MSQSRPTLHRKRRRILSETTPSHHLIENNNNYQHQPRHLPGNNKNTNSGNSDTQTPSPSPSPSFVPRGCLEFIDNPVLILTRQQLLTEDPPLQQNKKKNNKKNNSSNQPSKESEHGLQLLLDPSTIFVDFINNAFAELFGIPDVESFVGRSLDSYHMNNHKYNYLLSSRATTATNPTPATTPSDNQDREEKPESNINTPIEPFSWKVISSTTTTSSFLSGNKESTATTTTTTELLFKDLISQYFLSASDTNENNSDNNNNNNNNNTSNRRSGRRSNTNNNNNNTNPSKSHSNPTPVTISDTSPSPNFYSVTIHPYHDNSSLCCIFRNITDNDPNSTPNRISSTITSNNNNNNNNRSPNNDQPKADDIKNTTPDNSITSRPSPVYILPPISTKSFEELQSIRPTFLDLFDRYSQIKFAVVEYFDDIKDFKQLFWSWRSINAHNSSGENIVGKFAIR